MESGRHAGGIRTSEIIARAYTNRDGICPLLAAHRAGGRANGIAFAGAWDRFAFRDAGSDSGPASDRARAAVLKVHLEANLLAQDVPDADRRRELAGSPGWAWTRAVRRGDEYERGLTRLESERAGTERRYECTPASRLAVQDAAGAPTVSRRAAGR